MKTTTYGQRGGTGKTAGRKAETIEATADGVTYRKRVFFGQRCITVMQARGEKSPLVSTSADVDAGQRHVNSVVLSMGAGPCPIYFDVALALAAQPVRS